MTFQASPSITNSQGLLKLTSIESVRPSTISSSVILFSSHLQSFPESESFPMSQFFASGGQSIGVSVSASVLLMNIQEWFPLGGTGWISLLYEGLSRIFSNTTIQKHQFFSAQLSLWSNSHIHTWLWKNHSSYLPGKIGYHTAEELMGREILMWPSLENFVCHKGADTFMNESLLRGY